jgi:hypothetical protein
MITCSITKNQQIKLAALLLKELDEAAVKNTPYDVNNTLRYIYDVVNKNQNNREMAFDYARLVPRFVMTMATWNNKTDALLDDQYSNIRKLARSFEEDIKNVEQFFSVNASDVQAAKNLQKGIERERFDTDKQLNVKPKGTKAKTVVIESLPFIESTQEKYHPEEYVIEAGVRDRIIDAKPEEGKLTDIPGIGRVKLVAMSASKVPDDQRKPNELIYMEKLKSSGQSLAGDVYLFLVDAANNPVYVNENFERAGENTGKMVYYNIYKPTNTKGEKKKTITESNPYIAQRISYFKSLGNNQEQADSLIQREISNIENIRKYINQNPETNFVEFHITGGAYKVQSGMERKENPLGKLQRSGLKIEDVSGPTISFSIEGIKPSKGKYLTAERNNYPPELAEKIVSVLFDDLSYGGKPIDINTRIRLSSQFVFFTAKGLDIDYRSGELKLLRFGKEITGTIDQKKDAVYKHLTAILPGEDITEKQAEGKKQHFFQNLRASDYNAKVDSGEIKPGHVLVMLDENNKPIRYRKIDRMRINMKKALLSTNSYEDFEVEDGKVISKPNQSYVDFVINNASVLYSVDNNGRLNTTPGYLNITPVTQSFEEIQKDNKSEELIQTEEAPIVQAPNPILTETRDVQTLTEEQLLAQLEAEENALYEEEQKAAKNDDGSIRNKLFEQKQLNRKATSAQNIEAETWFKNTFKGRVSFKDMTHMANMSNPRSIATWQTSGITLYHGAEYSDLYHEAWHSFTQSFLSKSDKIQLYDELRTKKGTFKDYNGKTATFSKASELQLEEFLAEDFRAYMLNGGKIDNSSPIRNSLFRRIINFLKALFGKTTLSDLAVDNNVNRTVKDFYDKLRAGDLNQYSFSTENRNFNTLHKGLEAYKSDEPIRSLGISDSKLITDSLDSLFSMYADAKNAGLTGSQYLRKQSLVTKYAMLPDIGLTKEQQIEKDQIENELRELIGNQTYKNSTEIFETGYGLQLAYKNALIGLKRQQILINSLLEREKLKSDPIESNITELQNKLNIVEYSIRNFGDPDKLSSNKSGVIAYHLKNSSFFKPETIAEILEEDLTEQSNDEGKNIFDRGGQDHSIAELAERDVEILLRSLQKVNKDGTKALNRIGVPELEDYKVALRRIAGFCQNISTIQEMKKSLEKNASLYLPINQLLEKLGPIRYEGQSAREEDLWTKFWQTMNKYRIPLVQMNIDKVEPMDENGAVTGPATFEVKIGQTGSEVREIQKEWENQFALGSSEAFIINSDRGNYLDLNRIIETFPDKNSIKGKEYEFLKALGINLKDDIQLKEELSKAVDRGDIKLDAIPEKMQKLQAVGFSLKSIGAIMGSYKDLGLASEFGNYNKIAELEIKYSGERSDYMRLNATGEPQSEFSLNNSITQMLKKINEANSFAELVGADNEGNVTMGGMNSMSYLAPYNDGKLQNPFLSSSVFMNAIFDFNKPGAPKKRKAVLILENLSGLAYLDNGRETDNKSETFTTDAASKLIMDLHMQLITGNPEVPRHADKTTSYSVYVDDLGLGNKQKNLFVDTYQFLPAGQSNLFVLPIMKKYLLSELARVKEARYLLETKDAVIDYDFDYLKRGSNFTYFEDVLSQTTKDRLINQTSEDMAKFLESQEGLSLNEAIEEDINNYLDKQYKLVSGEFLKQPFIADQLKTLVRDHAKSVGIVSVTDADLQAAILKSFVANNWMHKYETGNLLYGDLALYKDYNKRIASAASTGDLMRSDEDWIESVNQRLGQPYAKSIGVDPLKYDGFIKTAIVAEIKIPSAYYDIYEKDLNNKVEKYGDVEEADAQALMAFDMYRIVSKSVSQWSPDQERVFNKIVNKERLTDEDNGVVFPVLKMSYFGPLYNGNLSLRALHKFSLFPLIPSVIKGTNLEDIHNKMSRENIGYLTFKSGSKIATVTHKKNIDKLYENVENNTISTEKYTPNVIHSDFLKLQIKPSTKVKKQISFFTQMRLMIDSGLIENGVPVDYAGNKETWDTLSDQGKKEASDYYTKRTAFKDAVYELSGVKKAELLKEIGGIMDKDGNLVVDMTKLLDLVNRELSTRREMAEHELEFIQMKDGKLKWDLSLSPSAEQIEKVLTAVINKRLINYKVNGNELVMVAATGFEKKGHTRKFTKPTEEDLAKYGSNDLPTYHRGVNGITVAAKCKLPMQNDFKKLLSKTEVRDLAYEKNISRLDALNELLKNEEWLNTGDNRKMISMVGARRPTQGLNSMEFVEVYEFLPEEAGSIIILPTEITAKMGADFDYDKLPMMMPHLKNIEGNVVLYKQFSKEEAAELHKALVDSQFNKLLNTGLDPDDVDKYFSNPAKTGLDQTMRKFFGEDYLGEIKEILFEEEIVPSLEEFEEKLISPSKIAENKIQQSARELLELSANFKNLITPNDTDLVYQTAMDLKKVTAGYSSSEFVVNGSRRFSPTRNMEIIHNLSTQQTNSVAKDALGIAAVHNKFNPVFAMSGAYLPASYTLNPKAKEPYYFRNALLLPHNTIKKGDKDVISLGKLEGQDKKNIADVLSQLLNGWLDAAKDDFIFYLKGNKELTPILTFLVQAGVPIEDAAYFISQPLIREYVENIKQRRGALAPVLGKQSDMYKEKDDAFWDVVGNPVNGFTSFITPGMPKTQINDSTVKLTDAVAPEGFKLDKLKSALDNYNHADMVGNVYQANDFDRAVFLHFIEIEGIEEAITKVKRSLNFDTDLKQTFSEMAEKENNFGRVVGSNRIDYPVIKAMTVDSPLGAYRVQNIASVFEDKLFPLFTNEVISDFILEEVKPNKMFENTEAAKKAFKQDLVSYIFQNEIRKFDKNSDRYAGLNVDDIKLTNDYSSKVFSTKEYNERGYAAINKNAFGSEYEFRHFVYEREALRSLYPVDVAKQELDYKNILAIQEKNPNNKKEDGTNVTEYVAYEQFLRNRALMNIYNPWQLFKSHTSIADTFLMIKNAYPNLARQYPLIKNLVFDDSGKLGYRNLRLSTTKLKKQEIEIFYENINDLANKFVGNGADTQFVRDFFTKFPYYAMMQSGLSMRGKFAMGRIAPYTNILALMEKPVADFKKNVTPALMSDIYVKFQIQNARPGARVRSKDYLSTTIYQLMEEVPVVENAVEPVVETENKNEQIIVVNNIPNLEDKIKDFKDQFGELTYVQTNLLSGGLYKKTPRIKVNNSDYRITNSDMIGLHQSFYIGKHSYHYATDLFGTNGGKIIYYIDSKENTSDNAEEQHNKAWEIYRKERLVDFNPHEKPNLNKKIYHADTAYTNSSPILEAIGEKVTIKSTSDSKILKEGVIKSVSENFNITFEDGSNFQLTKVKGQRNYNQIVYKYTKEGDYFEVVEESENVKYKSISDDEMREIKKNSDCQ